VFYVLGELTGRVSVHGFNKKRIALLQSIAADTVSKQPGSADIHVSPDGRFLYASNRADANSLAVYRIDAGDGRLLPVGLVATGGRQPRNFTLDPSGRFLLVANQATNNIVVFRIDPQTGIPAPTGFELTLPTPVCLVFKKP
jgi:6-phosphogluconolactonase